MSRRYKILAIIYFIVLAVILIKTDNYSLISNNLEYVKCGNAAHIPKPVPQLTTVAYTLLIVATPLVLIVFSIITLVKAIMSGNIDDVSKAKGKLLKKVIYTAVIFLVAGLTRFIINRVTTNGEDKNTFAACMKCFLYYSNSACQTSDSGNPEDRTGTHRSQSNYSSGKTSDEAASDRAANKSNSNSSNGSTSNNSSDQSLISNTNLYIGDSRTVGLCNYSDNNLHSNEKCFDGITISQVGKDYSWFENTGVSEAKKILDANKNKKYNIIIWMGTNDIGNNSSIAINSAKKYAKKIGELASGDFKNQQIIIVPVTRVDDTKLSKNGYAITQANVTKFNDTLKGSSEINKSNIRYCTNMLTEDYVSNNSTDGLHYTSYVKINTAIGSCLISK